MPSPDTRMGSRPHRATDRTVRVPLSGARSPSPWCKSSFVDYKLLWHERNREKHIAHVRRARDQKGDENQLRVWQYCAAPMCRLRRARSGGPPVRSSPRQARRRRGHVHRWIRLVDHSYRDGEVRDPLRELPRPIRPLASGVSGNAKLITAPQALPRTECSP
jgi:hypothetical protein